MNQFKIKIQGENSQNLTHTLGTVIDKMSTHLGNTGSEVTEMDAISM